MLIGLCGYPGAGKTEVQKILTEFGFTPVDDGRILRDFAKQAFGLSETDVSTPLGKKRSTNICKKDWEHRKILGEFGRVLEELFGEDVLPEIALRGLDVEKGNYSFGSVRKTQGWVYRRQGGFVLEVKRPGVEWSGNEFDKFDRACVDAIVNNEGSLEDLRLIMEHYVLPDLMRKHAIANNIFS